MQELTITGRSRHKLNIIAKQHKDGHQKRHILKLKEAKEIKMDQTQ